MEKNIDRRHFITGVTATAAAGLALSLGSKNYSGTAHAAANAAETAYVSPTGEKDLPIEQILDLEAQAAKVIPAGAFAYISKGIEKEWTINENKRAFNDFRLLPDYLGGKDAPDTKITLLGSELSFPVLVTPMGAHMLANKAGEVATASGAAAAGTLMTLSAACNLPLEVVAQASQGPKWFQIYFFEEQAGTAKILKEAKDAGYSAIVFTVDAVAPGSSDDALRQKFSFPKNLPMAYMGKSGRTKSKLSWDDMKMIQDITGLPVIVKGVMTPKFAEKALKMGAAALQVSNHGGRQLDGMPASISVLPSIVKAVKGQVPIILDSGIRRGSDVLKALALGADAVALGRPVLYGLSLGGASGVKGVLQQLKSEVERGMAVIGAGKVKDLNADMVQIIS